MSAAPRTHAPPSPRPQRRQDAQEIVAQPTPAQVKFYRLIYGEAHGWVEVCQSEGPPDARPRPRVTRMRWVWYSPETVDELAGIVATLAANGRDTYVSWAVYSDKQRNKVYALPGPSIFVDDAPEGDYSFKVLTGARRPHGWRILDTPADTATREDLARRIAYTGGDTSGWDITQLVRPPDTINTKQAYGGRYPVGIGLGTNQRYSVDALAAQFPPVAATQDAGALDIDDQDLKHWLGNVDACMRRIRPGTPTYQTLQGDGGADRSVSRWATACNLRKLYGLPNVEIAAILLTFCDWGHSKEKGSVWFRADVKRCIADAEEKYPHATINPTRGTQARPAVTLPEVVRQPRGRRRTYRADEYLAWLWEHADASHVMQTQRQLAGAYDSSVATIRRLEHELHEQGEITRHKTGNRQSSWLELRRAITNTPAVENTAVDAAENEPEAVPDVLSQTPRIKDAPAYVEEHTAPGTPSAPLPFPGPYPTAAAAMREAFAVYCNEARITQRKIDAYLMAVYPGAPWDGALLQRCYEIELKRRQRQRQRDQQLAALPRMPHAKLRRLERWCERLLEDGPDGPRGGQYYMARWLAPHVAQELASERRRAALERVKIRPGRRPAPVHPWTELDATPMQELTKVDAMPPLLTLVDAPDQVTKSHTLTPAAVHPAQPVIVPQQALQPAQDAPGELVIPCVVQPTAYPMDDAKVKHIEVKRPTAGAPLGAVCSPLPACPTVPEVMTPAARIRPYVPVGGWTPATIAALPGVVCGNVAADEPWIALQRELAVRAAVQA